MTDCNFFYQDKDPMMHDAIYGFAYRYRQVRIKTKDFPKLFIFTLPMQLWEIFATWKVQTSERVQPGPQEIEGAGADPERPLQLGQEH